MKTIALNFAKILVTLLALITLTGCNYGKPLPSFPASTNPNSVFLFRASDEAHLMLGTFIENDIVQIRWDSTNSIFCQLNGEIVLDDGYASFPATYESDGNVYVTVTCLLQDLHWESVTSSAPDYWAVENKP